jgi:hypothetical protein
MTTMRDSLGPLWPAYVETINKARLLTQPVRDHMAAMQRLKDQYSASLKRAEAAYFEGVKRANAMKLV